MVYCSGMAQTNESPEHSGRFILPSEVKVLQTKHSPETPAGLAAWMGLVLVLGRKILWPCQTSSATGCQVG